MSRFNEDDVGDPGTGGDSPIVGVVWLDVNWSFTEPPPTGQATGFEVVLYKGSNPDDPTQYIMSPRLVPVIDRRLVVTTSALTGTSTTINASVRTVYPWGKSAWANTGATASMTPPTTQQIAVDNLIPNPTSEQGALAVGYAAAALVNDAGNAYAGSWCRRTSSATAADAVAMTPKIACVYGDEFTFTVYFKSSSTTNSGPTLMLNFYDASLAFVGQAYNIRTSSTTYAAATVRGAVPAGAMYVQAYVGHQTLVAAAFNYWDNLSLRRAVNFTNMTADEGFRVGNAIGNTGTTVNDRVYYRGNNDPATLGGAPAIATLTITPQTWDTTNKQVMAELKLQPTAASSNLDGMRYAKVVLYRQSAAGTTGTLTALKTYYVPLRDRLYNNSTDSNAANASINGMSNFDSGITSGFPAMLVTIYNAVGPSDTNCYYSGAGWTAGTALTNNGTSWPAGLTGGTGGSTGGGSGGGGPCPAPWMMIDLPDVDGELRQKRADELVVGEIVKTIHPSTRTRGRWPIKAISVSEAERWDVWVEGRDEPYTWTFNHRIMTDKGWKEVNTLEPGNIWTGFNDAVIVNSQYRDIGTVIKLTVDMAGSYCTDGLLSSNIKDDPGV